MRLTEKEKQITELMIMGFDNDEICEELIIGKATLKTHMTNIYKKFGIKKNSHTNDCRSLLILKLLDLKIKHANANLKIAKDKYKKTINLFIDIYQKRQACINCPASFMNVDCEKKKDICLRQIWDLMQ